MIEDKIFYSYNEITKYFDVRVIMVDKDKYTVILSKKKPGGNKNPSKYDLLNQKIDDINDSLNKKIDKLIESFNLFKDQQLQFNEMVIQLFKEHGWVKK